MNLSMELSIELSMELSMELSLAELFTGYVYRSLLHYDSDKLI